MTQLTEPSDLYTRPDALRHFDGPPGLTPAEACLVREFFPPAPARVLDLGCGNGRTTYPLHRLGYAVTGLDITPALIAAAVRRHPGVEFIVGDARSVPYPDATFDAVLFSWNGIDHLCPVVDRLLCLREVRRILKPGGAFLFSSHNALGMCYRCVRSLFLLRNALSFIRDQWSSTRGAPAWYCAWRDPSLGKPLLFSAPPRVNVRMLREAGLDVLAVRSQDSPERPARALRDVHVQYACRRPTHGGGAP